MIEDQLRTKARVRLNMTRHALIKALSRLDHAIQHPCPSNMATMWDGLSYAEEAIVDLRAKPRLLKRQK